MIAASQARPGRDWSRHDVQLLSILASHSAIVIDKASLRMDSESKRRLEIEKEAMEKELRVAHDIQMRFVPEAPLHCGPWDVDGRLVPARQVGGDFYDFFGLEDGRAALVIGDVAGKGVPAALLVSTVQSALRAYAGLRLEPLPLIEQLNRRVAQSVAAGRFVTLFYAELDPVARVMRYVNAGHVWPRVRRANGDLESIPAGGIPLGIFENTTFEQGECRLGPDDSVLMYSDGIPDAINAFNHDFGEERIAQLWRKHGAGPTPAVLDRLMADVTTFSGSAPQSDDQTVMVLCPAARG
jgi:sigma-B regulation protein RsbU (phosphoserine phosphatase)